MTEKFHVKGYGDFIELMKSIDGDISKEASEGGFKPIPKGMMVNILFSGEKDEKGVSWCPDCVLAEEPLSDALEKFGENTVLVIVDVGDRSSWKDMNNPFRKDKDTHLSVIPTLIRWKNPQRLEGDQLLKPELLQMFFADED